ncbi:MAG TPA: sporulation protein YpjB [Pseudogracilibacillus sp.]|nr:sporulation protein YpjB [Pseudogracilibacillus sp.]
MSLIFISIIQMNDSYANRDVVDTYSYVTDIPFPAMITLIGGVIFVTLSYVSWRKYKGERKKRRDKIN